MISLRVIRMGLHTGLQKLSYITFIALFVSSCQVFNAQDEAPLSIPYQKYTLTNGLTVILHEDHSDPVVHVDVTYHVGSAREEVGKSGFAHLFEHMMFQGSENVADEEHIKFVTEAGGTVNGTTNRDRTNYYQTVPSNQLETMLWLESDRMGFFLEGITQEKFEIQRATVKNEKHQNYTNRPYGGAFELITKALYPPSHPYSWLTIGDLEDLDRASAEDLRDFFLRWYGPNNATLTIGGHINPEEVRKLVDKYFGSIPSGPSIPPLEAPAFSLDQDRYVSYYDKNIRFPAVTMSFPTVKHFHPDAPALACLSEILGGGKGSYLYQNLVASQKAIQASASHRSDELAGEFFMFVLPYPGKSLTDFEQELRNALSNFEENGVSDDDLQQYKARYESKFIHGLEKVSGKTSALAHYETFAGEPDFFNKELQAHLAITKEDVMRVYDKYIKNQPSVVLSVLSTPEEAPARPDNFSPPAKDLSLNTERETLTYTKAKDNFDRSIKPEAGVAEPVKPPKFWKEKLENNVRVIGANNTELPSISFTINLRGGYLLDALNKEKLGLASLTAEMMNTSTKNFSEKEMAEELEKLGSAIHISAGSQRFRISVNALSKNFNQTIKLLEEKLFHPVFNETDFKRLQTQSIESALSSTKSASSIASGVYDKILYGEDHLFGLTDTQYIPSLKQLTAEDTRAFYEQHFTINNAEIVVVGDISKQEFLSSLSFLNTFQSKPTTRTELPRPPKAETATVYVVNKPDAAQSEIRVGYLTDTPYDATGEHYKRHLMNFTLGGAFNSRINLNLREDKGVTYGARSGFESSELPGPFTVSTSVKAEATILSVKEILSEISRFRETPITEEELNFLKQAIDQRSALKYESNQQKASFLSRILRFNVDPKFTKAQKAIIKNIDQEEILDLAKKHLPMERMSILIVGDKSQFEDELSSLELPVIELDAEGNAI